MKTQVNSIDSSVANNPLLRRIQPRGKPANFVALYGPKLQQACEESEDDTDNEDEEENEDDGDHVIVTSCSISREEELEHRKAVAIVAMKRERVYTSQEQQHSDELDLRSVMDILAKFYDHNPLELKAMKVVELQQHHHHPQSLSSTY
ncbi:GH23047 [Drosophila grimshawi]|uniref:GH23047 n=1 Tax=Drosophila grimshawi TaxID=7222 RepID=B4JWI6_DROGR|nr:GH23047 [Drosophila grimshawi]